MYQTRHELLEQVAAWYYEENRTQEEIARRLGLSRSTISRLLQEAREEGIVVIRVNKLINVDAELGATLVRTFSLVDAWVLAEAPPVSTLIQHLGELCARFLQRQLHDGIKIGIGWGTAVYETARNVANIPLRDAVVIQLLGAVARGHSTVDGPECARLLAQKLGATIRFLHAPALVESEATALALLQEPAILSTMELIRQVEVAITGIGTIDPELSSLHRAGFLTDADLRELARAGAVGDVLGYQFDLQGRVLDISLNRRLIAANQQMLAQIPKVVGVAGGLAKASAILGALRGKFINVLITDARTAAEILRLNS
ncbi:MAG: sugar-binding transcriptional regulator [Anaerolineae bacterium]|nr:sugar-binding transcriptional regulator [Anaerolineae bacterium]